MRIAFMGTPEFSVPTLDALAATHDIAAVYTQPPRPAGRGKRPRPTPVAERAGELGLEIRTPLNFRAPADRASFAALELDVAVVVAYGLLLPVELLEAPVHGCFNLHASLLPRWRGAAPIQRAVMAGDTETGVCVMKMEAGLDTGPVASTAVTPIRASDTASSVHDRLAALGAPLMVEALARLASGDLKLTAQPAEGVYAAKIDKTETRIDWRRPSEVVDRQIRGLSRFPGAWFMMEGERVKALMAEAVPGAGAPGEVLDDRLAIACGSGAVRLTRLQRAGGAPMEAEAFLRGRPVAAGAILEGA
ncbi:methionyl-tRNA formyltransferase [Pikeienuella sp. HZG-20]|uniref:methionyl-tRNA formyltransferase n=1 Tax=Paludibacillus litoralis TaxID=3133267 RepID=UPI0030EBEBB6